MATISEAWIPAMVFGNAFAAFWVFMMLLTKSPALSAALSRLMRIFFPFGRRKKEASAESPLSSDIRSIVAHFNALHGDHGDAGDALPIRSSADRASGVMSTAESLPSPELVRRHVSRSQSAVIAPVRLEWRDIGCSYRTGNHTKVVLEGKPLHPLETAGGSRYPVTGVCGMVKPRQMMALMGPSGAGKSTLLDILTMRKNVGLVSGDVLVNGQKRETNFLGNSSYVPQEDNFVPTMTVLETLTFYASLVLPKNLSSKEKQSRVLDVLNMVGLGEAKHTMVGGLLPGGIHFRGLSGGERRRLSIATGVVSAPSVLFLDEPTSGLDSFAALNVMQYMRTLADCKHHTVIASIHQPRMGIWNMFDQALILSKGRMMYSGFLKEVVPWFSRGLGYDYDAEVHGVVSDWVMDLVSIGFSKPKEFYGESMHSIGEVRTAATRFLEKYQRDRGYNGEWEVLELEAATEDNALTWIQHKADHSVVKLSKTRESVRRLSPFGNAGRYSTSWFAQFMNLYWRSFLNITRNPADVAGRMLTFTYVGLFVGLIFYGLADGAESVITRLNLLYNSSAFYMFIPYISMSLFTSDRKFYSADVQAKLYHPSAYYISNVLASLPFSVANATVFALVVYGLTGLRDDLESMFQNLAILVLESLIATQVLYFAAMITPNQDMAFMVAIAFTAVNILLSNFFIPFERIELSWISWLRWLSAMGYTWNGITKIEFQDRDFSCAQGASALFPDVEGAIRDGLPNLNPGQASLFTTIVTDPDPDCVVHTNQILSFFGIDTAFWTTIAILIGYLCVLHVLTFAGLRFVSFKDKK